MGRQGFHGQDRAIFFCVPEVLPLQFAQLIAHLVPVPAENRLPFFGVAAGQVAFRFVNQGRIGDWDHALGVVGGGAFAGPPYPAFGVGQDHQGIPHGPQDEVRPVKALNLATWNATI